MLASRVLDPGLISRVIVGLERPHSNPILQIGLQGLRPPAVWNLEVVHSVGQIDGLAVCHRFSQSSQSM